MKRLLLAGGGHAHVGVLQALAARPLQDTEVTLVTPAARQIYSGMLPGWIAGHYTLDQCVIPLAPAAARAGVRLLLGHVTGLDLAARQARVLPADGNPGITALPFDLLSIDTGPVTDASPIAGAAEAAVPLRPLERFVARWPDLQRQLTARPPGHDAATLSVIGVVLLALGVTTTVYWLVPTCLKVPTVPPVTLSLLSAKSTTGSLKLSV